MKDYFKNIEVPNLLVGWFCYLAGLSLFAFGNFSAYQTLPLRFYEYNPFRQQGFLLSVGVVLLVMGYLITILNYQKISKYAALLKIGLFLTMMVSVLALPYSSCDAYYYVVRGFSSFAENPFISPLNFTGWAPISESFIGPGLQGIVYPYGYLALWQLQLTFILSFGIEQLYLALLTLEGIFLSLLIARKIYQESGWLKKTFSRSVFYIIFLLNPILWSEGWINRHNDLLGIFILLLAFTAFKREKWLVGVFWFFLSLQVKANFILLIPLLVFYLWKKKVLNPTSAFLMSLLLVGILLPYPIFYGIDTILPGLESLNNFLSGPVVLGLYGSILAILRILTLDYPAPVLQEVTRYIIYAVLFFYMMFRIYRIRSRNIDFNYFYYLCFELYLVYVLVLNPTFMPWHLLWLIPFLPRVFDNINKQKLPFIGRAIMLIFILWGFLGISNSEVLFSMESFTFLVAGLLLYVLGYFMLRPFIFSEQS